MSFSGVLISGRRGSAGPSPGFPSTGTVHRLIVHFSACLLVVASVLRVGPYAGELPPLWAGTGDISGTSSHTVHPARQVLTLDQAIGLGLSGNPEIGKERADLARAAAFSIRAGELADPKIVIGEQYFPINLGMGESVLTMTTAGVRQSFLPWGQRSLIHQSAGLEKNASLWKLEDRKALLVRDIRIAWVEMIRIHRTENFLRSIGQLWEKAFQSALVRYRQGTGSESDVLLSQFQKDEIGDRLESLSLQKEEHLHLLMRLMHFSRPFRISPEEPRFPVLPSDVLLLGRLKDHPALQSLDAKVAAQERRVRASEKDKIPAVTVEGDYSYFMGPNLITSTPNLFSVLLTFNLPVRPGERQDPKIAEEEHELEALEDDREAIRQRLIEKVRDAEGAYRHLLRRRDLFDRILLPEAKRNVEAALAAYGTGILGMDRVLRAMEKLENVGIQEFSIRTDILKSEARLSYLAGVLPGGNHEP